MLENSTVINIFLWAAYSGNIHPLNKLSPLGNDRSTKEHYRDLFIDFQNTAQELLTSSFTSYPQEKNAKSRWYWKWRMIIAVNFQFKQLESRSLKKSELQRDSNPWPPRYQCDALPTELWKPHIGSVVNLLSSYLPWVKWCEVYMMVLHCRIVGAFTLS